MPPPQSGVVRRADGPGVVDRDRSDSDSGSKVPFCEEPVQRSRPMTQWQDFSSDETMRASLAMQQQLDCAFVILLATGTGACGREQQQLTYVSCRQSCRRGKCLGLGLTGGSMESVSMCTSVMPSPSESLLSTDISES